MIRELSSMLRALRAFSQMAARFDRVDYMQLHDGLTLNGLVWASPRQAPSRRQLDRAGALGRVAQITDTGASCDFEEFACSA